MRAATLLAITLLLGAVFDASAQGLPPPPSVANAQHVTFGALIAIVFADQAKTKPAPGALVQRVRAGGVAATAGLMPGDIIIKFNGRDVDTPLVCVSEMGKLKHGDQVPIEVRRGTNVLNLTARF